MGAIDTRRRGHGPARAKAFLPTAFHAGLPQRAVLEAHFCTPRPSTCPWSSTTCRGAGRRPAARDRRDWQRTRRQGIKQATHNDASCAWAPAGATPSYSGENFGPLVRRARRRRRHLGHGERRGRPWRAAARAIETAAAAHRALPGEPHPSMHRARREKRAAPVLISARWRGHVGPRPTVRPTAVDFHAGARGLATGIRPLAPLEAEFHADIDAALAAATAAV